MSAPVLDTARLVLRGHTAHDLDDVLSLWCDPEVVRFIGGKPLGREEVWLRLLRHVGHWTVLGYGFWVARDRATGRIVGEVGLADFRRDLDPPFSSGPEAGWVLAPWAHGRGLATEAMSAVLAWADAVPAVGARVTCLIDDGNAASARVAGKLGFRRVGQAPYKGAAVNLYERVR